MKGRILLYVLAAVSGALFACAAAANAQCPSCQNGQCPAHSPPLAPTTTWAVPAAPAAKATTTTPATATTTVGDCRPVPVVLAHPIIEQLKTWLADHRSRVTHERGLLPLLKDRLHRCHLLPRRH